MAHAVLQNKHVESDRERKERQRAHQLALVRPFSDVSASRVQVIGGPLSASLTPLIGRDREIAEVCRMLGRPEVRLLVLTGPGGVGKTRLAMAAAEILLQRYRDGVYAISLAGLHDRSLLLPAIASALDLSDQGHQPLLQRLTGFLHTRQILLVLDNLEHIIEAAPYVLELLAGAPGVDVIVTSRVALHVSAEQRYLVLPLALPDPEQRSRAALAQTPAVELFVQRARSIVPSFTLTERNARAIAEICRRLDGLPLAIELAAARVGILPPDALLDRLVRRPSLALLTDGPRDLPARHRTLRGTMTWSYDLLPPEARRLFLALAVFVDGCTLEGLEAVAGNVELNLVSMLIDASLVRQVETEGEPRLMMLQTIREFGLEQLEKSEWDSRIRNRHAAFYTAFVERAEHELAGSKQREWLDRLEQEQGNIRAATAWSVAHGDSETALRLASLWQFYLLRGRITEGRQQLREVLDTSGAQMTSAHIPALRAAAYLALYQGNYGESLHLARQSVDLVRALGAEHELALSLTGLGLSTQMTGAMDGALSLYHEAVSLARVSPDRAALAHALLLCSLNPHDRHRQIHLEESLQIYRELDNHWGQASVLHALGCGALAGRAFRQAREFFASGFRAAAELRHRVLMTMHLDGLAAAAAGQRHFREALRFGSAADALVQQVMAARTPSMVAMRAAMLDRVERALDEEDIMQIRMEGAALSVADLLSMLESPSTARHSSSSRPAGLTRREVEVLRLVAQGLSNNDVAEALTVSPRTVDAHLVSIYGKIGVSSRSGATRFAIEQGLVNVDS